MENYTLYHHLASKSYEFFGFTKMNGFIVEMHSNYAGIKISNSFSMMKFKFSERQRRDS